MKESKLLIISIFLVLLAVNAAFGFAGMTANNTTASQAGPKVNMDMNNSTSNDKDIVLSQHLIEIDDARYQSENIFSIKETLIFRNTGTRNFFGNLKTWVPVGSEGIGVFGAEMMTTGELVPLSFNLSGNIVSWQDFIEQNQTPLLYLIGYNVKIDQKDQSGIEKFSKKLYDPGFINYTYLEKPGFPAVVVKVQTDAGSTLKFYDENGSSVMPSETDETGLINKFNNPQFKEITTEILRTQNTENGTQTNTKQPGVSQMYVIYAVIGILILIAIVYLAMKNKSKSDEKEEDNEEPESIEPQVSHNKQGKKSVSGELENQRDELLSKMKELDSEYESGNLLDEEYEEKRNLYQDKLKSIDEQSK